MIIIVILSSVLERSAGFEYNVLYIHTCVRACVRVCGVYRVQCK